jgi:hypothetical protein
MRAATDAPRDASGWNWVGVAPADTAGRVKLPRALLEEGVFDQHDEAYWGHETTTGTRRLPRPSRVRGVRASLNRGASVGRPTATAAPSPTSTLTATRTGRTRPSRTRTRRSTATSQSTSSTTTRPSSTTRRGASSSPRASSNAGCWASPTGGRPSSPNPRACSEVTSPSGGASRVPVGGRVAPCELGRRRVVDGGLQRP